MTQIAWQGLVHDVIELNEKTEGAETGCGMILRATPDKMTDAAVSCLQCISGEFEYAREMNALQALKDGFDPDGTWQDWVKKRAAYHKGKT